MKDKAHMTEHWLTWKREVEKRLHAYLISQTPPDEDCPESYGIWGEYYRDGISPEEAANNRESGKMRPNPPLYYWYIILDVAINVLKNDKGREFINFLKAREYLELLEKHEILLKSEIQSIEDCWLNGDYDAVMMRLTRKRDNYQNPEPETIEAAAEAAAILLRCGADDLEIWTGGLWPEPLVADGLKALCDYKKQVDKNEVIAKQNNNRFKAFVFTHLEKLPEPIWKKYRQYSDKHYSRRGIINASLSRSLTSMDDFVFNDGELENIGNLGDSPVYFSQERGIYLWKPETPEDPFVCEIWLTYPTLPKDWS